MSARLQLRVVNPKGEPGKPLPDRRNIAYLDDDDDIGTLTFDYLQGGTNAELLSEGTELSVSMGGLVLPNDRFTIVEWTKDTVVDGKRWTTWTCQSWLERLDEALVLPEKDEHLREDVVTNAERRELQEAREEWMHQAIRDAVEDAKYKAKQHNDRVRDRRTRSEEGAVSNQELKDLNHWGAHAIRWARGQIISRSQNWDHMCQSFVRQSFGLPGIYDTASEAWFAGLKRGNTPINDIPAGVPVYWGPNHVALSTGGGNCISTDVLRAGWPDEVPIATLHNGVHWSLTFRGWSPEVSGRRIYP